MKVVHFDFRIMHHDQSGVLLQPLTNAGFAWISDNIAQPRTWLGDNLFIEPRFIIAVIKGLAGDGLTLAPLSTRGQEEEKKPERGGARAKGRAQQKRR